MGGDEVVDRVVGQVVDIAEVGHHHRQEQGADEELGCPVTIDADGEKPFRDAEIEDRTNEGFGCLPIRCEDVGNLGTLTLSDVKQIL